MFRFFISALAGFLAGLATGFSGLSAAVFISPMLIGFLNFDSFEAVGIALASDVLASLISAYTYQKNGNIDIKKGRLLFIFVVLFSIIGSCLSFIFTANETNNIIMNYWLIISSLLLGLKLLFKPSEDNNLLKKLPFSFNLASILCGSYIGFVCGFQGTGGGLMMLFVLNIVLGFEFKKAVGTSVMIMSCCALIGSISHFYLSNETIDLFILISCIVFTLVGARIAAVIANKIEPIKVKRITGILIICSNLIVLISKICF